APKNLFCCWRDQYLSETRGVQLRSQRARLLEASGPIDKLPTAARRQVVSPSASFHLPSLDHAPEALIVVVRVIQLASFPRDYSTRAARSRAPGVGTVNSL